MKNIEFLTGYRGVAALWIIFFHLSTYLEFWLPAPLFAIVRKGYIAVDFFFILSGYVIALNYSKITQTQSGIKEFFIKRLARIYPLHIFMLVAYISIPLAYILTGRFYPDFSVNNRWSLLANVLLIHNWGFLSSLSWNIPSWSISSETASYLFFPFLINILNRVRSRVLILSILLMIPIALNILYTSLGYHTIGEGITRVGTIRCMAEFIIGVILFFVQRLYYYGIIFSYFIFSIGLFLFITIITVDAFPFLVPISFSAILFGTFATNNPIARCLSIRPIRFLGDISYSMYMVHYFIREWIKMLISVNSNSSPVWWLFLYLIVMLGLSYMLYRFLEIPARKYLSSLFLPNRIPIGIYQHSK